MCLSFSPCVRRFLVLCVVGPVLHKAVPFPLSLPAGILFLAAGFCPRCHAHAHTHTQEGRHTDSNEHTHTHGGTKEENKIDLRNKHLDGFEK